MSGNSRRLAGLLPLVLVIITVLLGSGSSQAATEVDLEQPVFPDVTSTYVILDWSRSEDWVFQRYEVWYKVTGDLYDAWRKVKEITSIDDTDYNVTGLVQGTRYQFKIVDCDLVGCQPSNVVSVTTLSVQSVTLYAIKDEDVTTSSIVLRWSLNPNPNVERYIVYEKKLDENVSFDDFSRFENHTVVSGLEEEKNYCFFVVVEDRWGGRSEPSNDVCESTKAEEGLDPLIVPLMVAVIALVSIIIILILFFRRRGTRWDGRGQLDPLSIMGIVLLVVAMALIIVGGQRANEGCFSSGLYWIAGGALLLGVDGTVFMRVPYGIVLGGSVAGVLALAGFLGSFVGAC